MAFCSTARPENRTSCHVPVPEFSEPGACSINCDIWRPLTGSVLMSRSLTLTPMRAELRSMVVLSACTVTLSFNPAGSSWRSSVNSCAASSRSPVYSSGAKLLKDDSIV